MNILKTIVTSGLCVMFTSLSLAMDSKLPIVQYAISDYIPMTLPSFDDMPQCVASSWDSLKNTVNNKMFDESAFKKLGWPVNDPTAQRELERSTAIYNRVNVALKKRDFYTEFAQDCDIINRRILVCQRALNAFEAHPDGVKLALHCIKHHHYILTPYDLTKFMSFVQSSKKTSQQGVDEIEQELALIKSALVDNPVLNSLIKKAPQKKDDKD